MDVYTGHCRKLLTQLAQIKGVTSITCVNNSCDKFLNYFFKVFCNIDVVCQNVNKVSIDGRYLVSRPLLPSFMKTLFLKDDWVYLQMLQGFQNLDFRSAPVGRPALRFSFGQDLYLHKVYA